MKRRVIPDIDVIRNGLGHYAAIKPVQLWLDANEPLLHRVLGSEERGLAYGKMGEIAGWESMGKTWLLLYLAVCAQHDDALVILVMLENRLDKRWARLIGLRTKDIVLIEPYLKEKPKPAKWDKMTPKAKRIWLARNETEDFASIEELSKEMITVVKKARKHWDKIFVGVDSIAAMVTLKEAEAGETNANMNTNNDLSRFLSRTLKQWALRAETQNAMFVFTNQLRVKPGVRFGNPEYTTGGNAVRLYTSWRVKIYRAKGGRMKNGSKTVGIKGFIHNFKNKVGGGSIEDAKIAYKFFFDRPLKFLEADDLEDTSKKGDKK